MTAVATQPSTTECKIVGKPIDRIDGRLKVTGRARYAADFPAQHLAYAVAFQSTIAKGRVRMIDSSQAWRQRGVIAVITHENAPRLYRVSMDHNPGKPGQTYLPLQDDRVHYAGQYLGMVVAETFTQARDAAMQIAISYNQQTPVISMEQAMADAFQPAKMGRGSKPEHERGDPDSALARSAIQISQTYTTPVENHNPMELSATTASWLGDRLMIYDATQWVDGARSVVSTWLGIAQDRVRVIDPYVGGAFGCKGSCWPHEVMAAVASKMTGRPVQLVLTRRQMFTCIGYRPRTIQRISLGADRGGRLKSIIHECASQTSSWRDPWAEPASQPSRMLYLCANVRTSQKLVPVNANTPTQMRAPGWATGTYALEVAMDELAVAAGIDPVELRLKNYADKDPEKNLPFSSKALRQCYLQGAERFGWKRRNPVAGSMRDGETMIGYGMATATYPTNQEEAQARVEVRPDGSAGVSTAAHDLGTGAYTILAQISSDALGIPLKQIEVKLGDSSLPMSPGAGGSQTSASAGSAVQAACKKAANALKERAGADVRSPLFGKEPREMQISDGRIQSINDPSLADSISDLLRRNGSRPVNVTAGAAPPADPDQAGETPHNPEDIERYSKHAWGAQFAEVRIDRSLRQIRVSRLVGAFAAGKILNPKTANSQVMGGIVWSVGMALLEQTIYDPTRGHVVTDNLADYLVPVNADVPAIDCFFVDEPDHVVNSLGAKGVGELGNTGMAAAIANAVYHATGIRVRDLPITLDKLL